MEKICGNCLLYKQGDGVCPIFQEKVNENDSGCRKFVSEINPCDFCGNGIVGLAEIVIMPDGEVYQSCKNCGDRIGTCTTCSMRVSCDFETNPIQIPKQVQKVVRQGNMQMQTVIRNPEREKKTCMKGCPCWDGEEYVCKRQYGMCNDWRVMKRVEM